jgi:hypothetical protein
LGTRTATAKPNGSTGNKANGGIKGTLTYFFNENFGLKPDTGAEVFVAQDWFEIPEQYIVGLYPEKITLGTLEGSNYTPVASYPVVKTTRADGTGNYEFNDVPAGKYTLVFKSSHAKSISNRDLKGKIRHIQITIDPGEIVDESLDFGVDERRAN